MLSWRGFPGVARVIKVSPVSLGYPLSVFNKIYSQTNKIGGKYLTGLADTHKHANAHTYILCNWKMVCDFLSRQTRRTETSNLARFVKTELPANY